MYMRDLIFARHAFALAALVGCGVLAVAQPAHADMITYDSYSVVNNNNVTINYAAISPGPYGSGQIDSYQAGQLVAASWCIDVTHDLYGSGVWNVTQASEDTSTGLSNIDNGGGNGTLLTWDTLGELGALANYGNQNLDSNPYVSSAVQLAMWDLEYGNAIATTSASAEVQALAANLLAEAQTGQLGSDTAVEWLTYCDANGCNQGQLVVVPEPSSLTVLPAGLFAFAGFVAWRRRRKSSGAVISV
jgi:hypothetical protein